MKKYFIVTFGCQMQKSDSERIATLLERKGYKLSSEIKEADIIVVNVCSVREKAVQKALNKIKKIRQENKKAEILATGCILSSDKKRFKELGVKIKKFSGLEKIMPKTAFVPIIRGCNNFCTYCVVPYTRGKEKSRPLDEIICEAKHLINKGAKEIILLGQNVNSYKYKKDGKEIDFADLLKILNKLAGNFKIRFLTNHPKDFSEKLIRTIAECEKVEKYIHLPIQSGDDEILRRMNRGYSAKEYLGLIKKIKENIPQVKISTDIIVGFPGETERHFQNTVAIVKKVDFYQIYVAKYSPRPQTLAFKLYKDDVPKEEKKRRENLLREIFAKKRSIILSQEKKTCGS